MHIFFVSMVRQNMEAKKPGYVFLCAVYRRNGEVILALLWTKKTFLSFIESFTGTIEPDKLTRTQLYGFIA